MNLKYKRVLLKLSGESLMGSKNSHIDPAVLEQYSDEIKAVKEQGVEIAIVIGGGNIFRGGQAEALGIECPLLALHSRQAIKSTGNIDGVLSPGVRLLQAPDGRRIQVVVIDLGPQYGWPHGCFIRD